MTNEPEVTAVVKLFDKGQLKAFVDITISFDPHELTLFGYRVIQDGDQLPWVAPPTSSYQKDGKPVNKKVLEFSRKLDQIIKVKILQEFEKERVAKTKWLDSFDQLLKT